MLTLTGRSNTQQYYSFSILLHVPRIHSRRVTVHTSGDIWHHISVEPKPKQIKSNQMKTVKSTNESSSFRWSLNAPKFAQEIKDCLYCTIVLLQCKSRGSCHTRLDSCFQPKVLSYMQQHTIGLLINYRPTIYVYGLNIQSISLLLQNTI